jgi:UDP-glucose 4-epimerase
MKSTILITGGAGYIGSKVSYDFTDRGYDVVVVDNLSTGHKKLINPKSKFYKADILNTKKIAKIIKDHKIKDIFHMAACISVEESMLNKEKYYLNNVEGTRSLCVAAGKNIKNIILSSTCAVYGHTKKKLVSEEAEINPLSYYGKTKHLSELIIKEYSKKNNFNYAILRYFNVAGSDEKLRTGCLSKNGQLINNLVANYKKKKYQINIFGKKYNTADGTCIRDYIHVSDLSKIHIKSMEYIKNKKKSLLINCGYGKSYTVLDIVKNFEFLTNKKFKLIFKKKRKGDVDKIAAETKKLSSKLKIKLLYNQNLNDMLTSSINWKIKNR